MTYGSISVSAPRGRGSPPPIPQRNPNRPRKNGPGCTPYYADSADLPQLGEGNSDEETSDGFGFTRMGIQCQQNPTIQAHPELLSPLNGGRPAPRQTMSFHNQSQSQQSAISQGRATSQTSPPICLSNGGFAVRGPKTSTSQYTPAMQVPNNQAPIYSQIPSAYTNDTPSSRHHGPTAPTGRELMINTHKAGVPTRGNTYPAPGLTEDRIAYHNSQFGPTSNRSHASSVDSRSSPRYRSISGRSRSSSVASGASRPSSQRESFSMVPYGYPAALYPIIEHPLGPFQFTPPQPTVVQNRTVQLSQTMGYYTVTYTEHQQVTILPPFY